MEAAKRKAHRVLQRAVEAVRANDCGYTVRSEPLEGRLLLSTTRVTSSSASSGSSYPGNFIDVNGTVYFAVSEDLNSSDGSNSLWKTDGTAAGTVPVKEDLGNNGGTYNFTSLNGTLYFQDNAQLWTSDGTVGGTTALHSFTSLYNGLSFNHAMISANGYLYFTAADKYPSTVRADLWRSDGTAAGTVPVAQTNPQGSSAAQNLTSVGSMVYFTADNGVNGRELWTTDGTSAGTMMVKDINPGAAGSTPSNLVNFNGVLYFTADDGVHGIELWRSDGTGAGTSLVADLAPGALGYSPNQLTVVGSSLYFVNQAGTELVKTDGTAAGTVVVSTIPAATNLTAFGGALYFCGGGSSAGLWRSDGTAAGTVKLAAVTAPANLVAANGLLYFSGRSTAAGAELWRSDGTGAGTAQLADIWPGASSSSPSSLTAAGGKLYFTASDASHGTEAWTSDGTAAGTSMLKDINFAGSGFNPEFLTRFRGQVYFFASPGNGVSVLYRTDGTPEGTRLIYQLPPSGNGDYPSVVSSTIVVGSTLYFVVGGSSHGPILFATDGTTAGTRQVRQMMNIRNMVGLNGFLYFSGYDTPATGYELYRTDGTTAGTILVKDIVPGTGDSDPQGLTAVGSTLLFWANDGTHGYELWKSDGTAAGTALVKDINPSGSSAFGGSYALTERAVLDGVMYFAADDGVHGRELWRSDGTPAGTYLVKDIDGGDYSVFDSSTDPSEVVAVPSGPAKGIYFFGIGAGRAVFKSDGTAAGTAALVTLNTDGGLTPYGLSAVGGHLFFVAPDMGGYDYFRLYSSDGTTAGTAIVRSFQVQTPASYVQVGSIVDVNGVAYFSALDTTDGHGNEIWRSDGTVAGTYRVTDVNPGSGWSIAAHTNTDPTYQWAVNDGAIIFSASDNVTGDELYRYTTGASSPAPAAASSLAATVVSGIQINLTWHDNSNNETGFRVERSTSPIFATIDHTEYLPGDTASYSDVGLVENTTYYYRVIAYNGGGDAAAAVTSAHTTGVPTSPTGLSAVAAGGADSGHLVNLSWADNSNDELGFRLERSFTANFASIDHSWTLSANTTTFADSTVAPFATHYYRLVAFNAVGDCVLPATASVLTPDILPADPSALVAWGISESAIQLQWTDNAVNDQSYLIERSDLGGVFQQVASVASGRSTYTDTSVTAGISYTYRVRAAGSAGYSGYSATATAAPLAPQLTGLVKDINSTATNLSSTPSTAVVSGGVAYFAAAGVTGGQELWRSDGTAIGTYRVADINPGAAGSNPVGLTDVNGTLYFFANGGTGRAGLWKTDGTASGTVFLAAVTFPTGAVPVKAADGTLYFAGNDSGAGTEIWKSDGTAAGTIRIKDIVPDSGSSSPSQLTAVGNTVFFTATTLGLGTELWKTDGTADGTILVKDIFPGTSAAPSQLTVVGSTLFFRANDGSSGGELWKSDGTAAGTVMVKDILAGSGASSPRYITNVNGTLFFAADSASGLGLWKSDGTDAGTVKVKDLPASIDRTWRTTSIGGTLYFVLTPTAGTQTWLYKSDGTSAGTSIVAEIAPGSTQGAISELVVSGAALYFISPGVEGWTTVWRSDGTAAGTAPLGGALVMTSLPSGLCALNGSVLFSATDVTGRELWHSDGTSAGTAQLKDVALQTGDANPAYLTSAGGSIFLSARDGSGTPGLYRTDGTEAGTSLVAASGTITAIYASGTSSAIFATFDAGVARLWKSGSTPGTAIQLNGALPTATPIDGFYPAGSLVFFRTRSTDGTIQLWRTDGTVAGTTQVAGVRPVAINASGQASVPVAFGGALYFAASSPSSPTGVELWKSDGTAAGTSLVKDINPGTADGGPSNLTVAGGHLYFVGYDAVHGWALWRSDGAAASTIAVRDGFSDGTSNAALTGLSAVGNTLFFSAADPNYGLYELWKSDGTTFGTTLVADLDPGYSGSSPSSITDVGGVAYFFASDSDRGLGLWRSDGTAAGTVRITDVTGVNTSPSYILNVKGTAYFADGGYLWKTDGTTTGTVRQMTLGANASPLAGGATAGVAGDRLVFVATGADYGRELWTLSLTPPVAPSHLTAVTATGGGNQVTWSDNAGNETGYVVERTLSGDPSSERKFFLSADSTKLVDPSAPKGAAVQYEVRAYNAAGTSVGVDATVVPIAPPTIVSWASAATHAKVGEVALAIPDDNSFVEDRLSGIRTLLVTFSSAINAASLTPAGVAVYGLNHAGQSLDLSGISITTSTRSGDTVAVLSFSKALPDYARYLVRLSGISGPGGALIGDNDRVLTALLGDATGDGRVNNTDVGAIQSLRGIDPINVAVVNQVRSDVTLDGRVNNTDVGGVTTLRGEDARSIPVPTAPANLVVPGSTPRALKAKQRVKHAP